MQTDMEKKRIVLALGGNALGNTPKEQLIKARGAARAIAQLIAEGNEIVIAHGNGPQVGMIHLGLSAAAQQGAIAADMPFPECGAMSQGYIGYHLQNSLQNELAARGMARDVVTLITQVAVDENDPAFLNPTKPIGAFYTQEEAGRLAAETGDAFREDAGRGYRRVVPSPRPTDVVEKNVIRALLSQGCVVIACGGGGVPVIRGAEGLRGVPAVIDKDFAACTLATLVDADLLVILTAVERVSLCFGTPNQRALERISAREAEEYCAQGHFAPGSMLPKVQAAAAFARRGGTAVIASLEKAYEAVHGQSGTAIYGDGPLGHTGG